MHSLPQRTESNVEGHCDEQQHTLHSVLRVRPESHLQTRISHRVPLRLTQTLEAQKMTKKDSKLATIGNMRGFLATLQI